ncbi:MAG: hypothetical protein ACREQI_06530 [Candidatus Binataceae bacterium]
MRNLSLILIIVCILSCSSFSKVLACAQVFPWQLLDDRAATLNTMPVDNSFAFAAAHLVPRPKDNLRPVELKDSDLQERAQQIFYAQRRGSPSNRVDYNTWQVNWNKAYREAKAEVFSSAEAEGLSDDQDAIVRQMRQAKTGDQAFKEGAALPIAVRLYTAGAVDYHRGDAAKAIARFRAILRLPKADRRSRSVWAAFMLGRLYGQAGKVREAAREFALTRALAIEGAPDPLGLAVASYGEEARLYLDRAHKLLKKGGKLPPNLRRPYGRGIATAVSLYAEQAARGSRSAVASLGIVANEVPDTQTKLSASISNPMVQRLLIARAITGWAMYNPPDKPGDSLLSELVSAMEKRGPRKIPEADELAALAYNSGNYRLASHLVRQTNTPLATWIKARLAMQKGDTASAIELYAEAAKAFPASGDTVTSDEADHALLVGENGVLTLSRGEYIDALNQLYPYSATYWGDVAYIAERVLTIDELKKFVDTHADTAVKPFVSLQNISLPYPPGDIEVESGPWFYSWDSRLERNPQARLRGLLGRRLVRAGRYQEALKYFALPEEKPSAPKIRKTAGVHGLSIGRPHAITRFGAVRTGKSEAVVMALIMDDAGQENVPQARKQAPEALKDVTNYVKALHDANTGQSSVNRARGWYRAAALLGNYSSGMEIMGYDGEPDYYTFGAGQSSLPVPNAFITKDERRRFKATVAKPDFPFHYRYLAVNEAIHAADLLPPRSQAFAAVLCQATSWMIDGESCPESAVKLRALPTYRLAASRAGAHRRWERWWGSWGGEVAVTRQDLTCQLYQRYLKEGAVVPWATHFGRHCPQPDFVEAAHFVQTEAARQVRRRHRAIRHRLLLALELLVPLLLIGAGAVWFLKRRAARPG